MKSFSPKAAAYLAVLLLAQPALCEKLQAPAFPPLTAGASTSGVIYSSSALTLTVIGHFGPIERMDIYSIHDGTETFDFALLGGVKFPRIFILLPDPGRYRVRGEQVDVVAVVDPAAPSSVIAPTIRRDCADEGALLISGTASGALAELMKVDVAVVSSDEKPLWWNGAEWTTTGVWLTASGQKTWEIRLPGSKKKDKGFIHVFASALSFAKVRESPHSTILQIPPECP